MQKNAVLAVKLAGSAWLLYAAFVAATLAVVSMPHGPYVGAVVLAAAALLCLVGTAFLWRSQSLHWLSGVAVALSVGLAVFGGSLVR